MPKCLQKAHRTSLSAPCIAYSCTHPCVSATHSRSADVALMRPPYAAAAAGKGLGPGSVFQRQPTRRSVSKHHDSLPHLDKFMAAADWADSVIRGILRL